MKILLVNPPYQTITSNVGVGHQVPLGLLMVGGALLDAGHAVRLLDAECRRLSRKAIVRAVSAFAPEVVLTGHAGSTPAHPVCLQTLRAIKDACPGVLTVYGGVYPTYHAARIVAEEPAVDFVVRGEGEATVVELLAALNAARTAPCATEVWGWGNTAPVPAPSLRDVAGITYRIAGEVVANPDRAPLADLDAYRVGWELIEAWDAYQCFGLGRAAIVQFSRGCPHRCTYCGQHGFWVKWRHRDPVRLADEIEWLYRTHDIRFVTLADENPTTKKALLQRFLEEVASRRLPVHFFATLRATDIVRDADILPLYRQAGVLYVLLGLDATDPEVLRQIRKGSTTRYDYQACRLLKQHGIFSILGHIVGLDDDTRATFRAALEQLIHYDGDYVNVMYATPHSWTAFARETADRAIVQRDQRKWDYRHQVLAGRHLTPRQLFACVKWLELRFHLRLARLWRMLATRDPFVRRQLWWTFLHTGMVWLAEVAEFLFVTAFERQPAPEVPRITPLRIVNADGTVEREAPLPIPAARVN